MQLASSVLSLFVFLSIGLAYGATASDDTNYASEIIKIHNLEPSIRREIMILRTKNRDKKAIQFTREQFEKTQKVDQEIQSKLQEIYRQKLEQTFAGEEIKYLRILYSSKIILKLQKFNDSVFKSPEAQALISSELKKSGSN